MRLKKLCALLLAVALTLGLCSCSIGKKGKYEKAVEAVRNGRYQEAIESLEALDGYEDSAKYITYARALQAGDSGDYENAIKTLEALNGFEKSAVYITSYTTLAYEAEQARMKSVYNQAAADVKAGNYDAAIAAFETLNDYEDSGKYIMYARCLKTGDSGDYNAAVKSLKTLGDFKDATMYIQYYTALGFEAEQKYEEATKVYEGILLFKDVQARVAALPDKILDRDLAEANTVYGKGGWRSASKLKGMLDRKYSDSDTRMYENVMAYALQWREQKRYDTAIAMYELLLDKGYENASEALKEAAYEYAKTSMDSGDYTKAEKLIKERLSDYKDTSDLLIECRYQQALKAEAKGADSAQAAYDAFKALGAYKDSADRVAAYESKYAEAVSKSEAGEFDAAIALFKELGTYSDSSAQLKKAQTAKAYASAVSLMNDEKYEEAIEAFKALNGYKDSEAQITECTYLKAETLRKNGKYKEAYIIYRTIPEYKDVAEIMQSDEDISAIVAYINEFQAGNYVTFGSYPQTEAGNDDTPIEWLVLEGDGETALLISRYGLDCEPYNTEFVDTTWEQCTLRGWLNNAFYNRAFSTEEKQSILQSEVSADKNPTYGSYPGNATKDNVFLLSIAETERYFTNKNEMKCAPTDYAIQRGIQGVSGYEVDGKAACQWWLRSPGDRNICAAFVAADGGLINFGSPVDDKRPAVRPCVRVRLLTAQEDTSFKATKKIDEGLCQSGDYVAFGNYPQTGEGKDNTPIEWLVLENNGETALLISRYALDCKMYNTVSEEITWEQCTLREWLNNEFYNRAFSAEEKQSVLQSEVSADENPGYDTNPGNATEDKVFLLSVVEAKKYFKGDNARMCVPTDYANQQEVYRNARRKVDGRSACMWWLRSPGCDSNFAARVDAGGIIKDSDVSHNHIAVRPCVRVRLSR